MLLRRSSARTSVVVATSFPASMANSSGPSVHASSSSSPSRRPVLLSRIGILCGVSPRSPIRRPDAPGDDSFGEDADDRPAYCGAVIRGGLDGGGRTLDHHRGRPPREGRGQVVDHERRPRILPYVAELLGSGEVQPRDVDGAELGIVAPPDRYHVRRAGRVRRRKPPEPPLAQQVTEFCLGERCQRSTCHAPAFLRRCRERAPGSLSRHLHARASRGARVVRKPTITAAANVCISSSVATIAAGAPAIENGPPNESKSAKAAKMRKARTGRRA